MATAERAPASWSAHRYSDAAGLDRLMLEAAAREHEARTMQLADHECRRCLQLTCTCHTTLEVAP